MNNIGREGLFYIGLSDSIGDPPLPCFDYPPHYRPYKTILQMCTDVFDNMKIVLYCVDMKSKRKTQDTQQAQEVHEVHNTQEVQQVSKPPVAVRRGRDLQASGQDLITRYIDSLDIRPRSRDTYRKSLKQFFLYLQEHGIRDPKRSDILAYKRFLLDHYTACTVSAYLTAVKGLFTYLEAERICPNVANGIRGAKHQRGFRKDALTVDQTRKVLGTIDRSDLEGMRNYALVNLLVRTGLRTVEAQRANAEDIRQEGGEALLYIQGKGRDSKDAFVILTESTLGPIREYLRARGRVPQDSPLFASLSDKNNGERLTTRSISRIVKVVLRFAGIDSDRLTAHSLRHTAVTFSLLGGASVQEAQLMARHGSVNTTMIYAHNIERIASAPERKIDALLGV